MYILKGVKFQKRLFEFGQALTLDAALAPAVLDQDALNGVECARRAHAFLPVLGLIAVANMGNFDTGTRIGLVKIGWVDIALGEAGMGIGHAAHLQALEALWLKPFADDELGAAAPDVDDQSSARVIGQCVCHAEIHQSCFFAAIDHIDPGAENGACWLRKLSAIFGHSQRIGTNNSDAIMIDTLEHLGEAGEAVKTPLNGLG